MGFTAEPHSAGLRHSSSPRRVSLDHSISRMPHIGEYADIDWRCHPDRLLQFGEGAFTGRS